MKTLDDVELLARIAKGDERALLELYDRYARRVYALALRILKEPMIAEEVMQDAFFKVWEHAPTYLPQRGSVLVWLLTITRRTAIDRLRHEARRPWLSMAIDPEELGRPLPDTGTFQQEADWHSLYLTVQSLPPEYRLVLELAYYQGLSQSEIANVLGWPLGTVKTRLREAMKRLRHAWGIDESKPEAGNV